MRDRLLGLVEIAMSNSKEGDAFAAILSLIALFMLGAFFGGVLGYFHGLDVGYITAVAHAANATRIACGAP